MTSSMTEVSSSIGAQEGTKSDVNAQTKNSPG